MFITMKMKKRYGGADDESCIENISIAGDWNIEIGKLDDYGADTCISLCIITTYFVRAGMRNLLHLPGKVDGCGNPVCD